ncbi:SAM-dependent methyltransferase [Agrobacterium sp. 22094]|uniref:SAM-dependent methyltransferase n=1 Tax=Agrobacterium sp. 22094 TaxID=3453872 RepID=UPI003F84E2E6
MKNKLSDWASWQIWNANSPSSDPETVKRIVREFLKNKDATALDIGGTKLGFVRELPGEFGDLEQRIKLVNVSGKKGIYRRRVRDVPEDDRYDLVMCFGTLMYMSKKEIRYTFEKARRLTKPGGSILVADPDGAQPVVWLETAMKWVAKLFWWTLPWRAHSKQKIAAILEDAGYTVKERPDYEVERKGLLLSVSPMRYYVLCGVKSVSETGNVGVSSPPTAAPAPARVTGRR